MNQKMNLGKIGEERACTFLREKGYKIIQKNYRNIFGEIDIIALRENCYSFIEVKTRSSYFWGYPEEAIGKLKRRRILRIASSYVNKMSLKDYELSFDIIAVLINKKNESEQVHFIENAYGVNYDC